MKRRSFLQQTGLAVAGSEIALASDSTLSHEAADVVSEGDSRRRVLVTSAHSVLARETADALHADYDVQLTAPTEIATRHPFTQNGLGHEKATNMLVRGMDAIVHVAEPGIDASEEEQIDYRTRCTYNLLRAATEERVPHVVYLSSLQMLTGYDEDFEVTEDWRPLPSDDADMLSHYLGEFTCREFAREGNVGVVVLRLGRIAKTEEVSGQPFDPTRVDQRDVVQAVSKVLGARFSGSGPLTRNWSVFHIQSGSPLARFTSNRAIGAFGYAPQFPQVHGLPAGKN